MPSDAQIRVERRASPRRPLTVDAARRLLRERPTVGVGSAAKQVVDDARELVRAEFALAKAEVGNAARTKATGGILLAAAGALAWLGLQGLLIAAGLGLALVLPAWAAALLVAIVLLLVSGGLALVAKRKLETPVTLDTTKHNVEEDVAVVRQRAHSNAAG